MLNNPRNSRRFSTRPTIHPLEPRLLFSTTLGTFSGSSKLTHSLPDGSKEIFSLTTGTGTLSQDDSGNLSITTTGTSISSTLSVAVSGKTKFASLSQITTDAPLGTLNLSKVNLTGGGLTIAGDSKKVFLAAVTSSALAFNGSSPLSMTLGNVSDTTVQSTQPFTSLSANSFLSSAAHVSSITAPWIGTLNCKTEFLPDLTLDGSGAPGGLALNTANVKGDVGGSTWKIAGNINTLNMLTGFDGFFNGCITGNVKTLNIGNGIYGSNLAAANFGTVKVGNSLSVARLLAGTNFGADGVLGGGDDTFAAGKIGSIKVGNSTNNAVVAAGLVLADETLSSNVLILTDNDSLLPNSSIGPITVNNTLSTNSHVLAATLPPTARIHFKPVPTVSDPRFILP
jgi:hypothetical protein